MIHDCRLELKNASLKVTPARLGVLEALESSPQPLDVGGVFEYLERSKIKADLATVFRTINAFADKGLTRSIQLNDGKARYEVSTKPDHHHLICEKCGLIEDISDCNIKKLEAEIEAKKQFKVRQHSLEFFGLCENCQNE